MRRVVVWAFLAAALVFPVRAQNFEVWAINYWVIDQFFPKFIQEWNQRNPNAQARLIQFENDPYKQRLFVALGAKSGPDVFYNWGGGVLESYAFVCYLTPTPRV
jgi:ABC-type glycerol-3-phosphate transport system substrate-binding protein